MASKWRSPGTAGRRQFHLRELVDAGTPIRLTQDPAFDAVPAWSPDGRFLAFVRLSPEGKGGYYVIPALGGAERKVADIPQTPSHRPYPSADWTPDSKSLVIVDTSVDPPALAQVSIADGDKKRLTSPPGSSLGDYSPAISPDGRWLAFNSVPGVNLQNWTVVSFTQAATSQPIPLAINGSGFFRARCAWTTDSAQLVCVEEGSGARGWFVSLFWARKARTYSGGGYKCHSASHRRARPPARLRPRVWEPEPLASGLAGIQGASSPGDRIDAH
jgi:dipeptidyl aminopeptidase/acylaminoacyl peptidase